MADDVKELGIHVKTTGDSAALEKVNRELDELNGKQIEKRRAEQDDQQSQQKLSDSTRRLHEETRTLASSVSVAKSAIDGQAVSIHGLVNVLRAAVSASASFITSILAGAAAGIAMAAGVKRIAEEAGSAGVAMQDLTPSAEAVAARLKMVEERKAAFAQLAADTKQAADDMERLASNIGRVADAEAGRRSAEAGKQLAQVDLDLANGKISKQEADSRKAGIRQDAAVVTAANELLTISAQIKALLKSGRAETDPEIVAMRQNETRAQLSLDTVFLTNRAERARERGAVEDASIGRSAASQQNARDRAAEAESSMTPAEREARALRSVQPLHDLPGPSVGAGPIGRATQDAAREVIAQAYEGQRSSEEMVQVLRDLGAVLGRNNREHKFNLERLKQEVDEIQSQLKNNGTR